MSNLSGSSDSSHDRSRAPLYRVSPALAGAIADGVVLASLEAGGPVQLPERRPGLAVRVAPTRRAVWQASLVGIALGLVPGSLRSVLGSRGAGLAHAANSVPGLRVLSDDAAQELDMSTPGTPGAPQPLYNPQPTPPTTPSPTTPRPTTPTVRPRPTAPTVRPRPTAPTVRPRPTAPTTPTRPPPEDPPPQDPPPQDPPPQDPPQDRPQPTRPTRPPARRLHPGLGVGPMPVRPGPSRPPPGLGAGPRPRPRPPTVDPLRPPGTPPTVDPLRPPGTPPEDPARPGRPRRRPPSVY